MHFSLSAGLLLISLFAATELEGESSPSYGVAKVVEKSLPSVVLVRIPKTIYDKDDTVGAGVIIHKDGYVISASHVVESRDTVQVELKAGEKYRKYRAKVLTTDRKRDLALLHIEADHEFEAISLEAAVDLHVGQQVVAIGHPCDCPFTATQGIVSGMKRAIRMPGGLALTDLIQTDAAINPGNSGGPLLTIDGKLIGINSVTAPFSQGISFAVSINTVRKFVAESRKGLRPAFVAPTKPDSPEEIGSIEAIEGANSSMKTVNSAPKASTLNTTSYRVSNPESHSRSFSSEPNFSRSTNPSYQKPCISFINWDELIPNSVGIGVTLLVLFARSAFLRLRNTTTRLVVSARRLISDCN